MVRMRMPSETHHHLVVVAGHERGDHVTPLLGQRDAANALGARPLRGYCSGAVRLP
jgi:hypothetical protein